MKYFSFNFIFKTISYNSQRKLINNALLRSMCTKEKTNNNHKFNTKPKDENANDKILSDDMMKKSIFKGLFQDIDKSIDCFYELTEKADGDKIFSKFLMININVFYLKVWFLKHSLILEPRGVMNVCNKLIFSS